MENIRVFRLGLGEVISSWGTYEGYPALFIEPASSPGVVGEFDPSFEPNDLRVGSVVLQIHNPSGLDIIKQDMESALDLFLPVKESE